MNTSNINFYLQGRDLAIKKKTPLRKLATSSRPYKSLDHNNLFSNLNKLYSYLVKESEDNPEIVPLSASWLLDNYYLISQQIVSFDDAFKPRIIKNLPLFESMEVHFQIQYIAKEYLKITQCDFSSETLIPFLMGYQKIYSLTSLELWILPIVIKFELLYSLHNKGQEIVEEIKNRKYTNSIVEAISLDLSRGKSPLKRIKRILHSPNINPLILLSLSESIHELDYRVEDTLELIEKKIHEIDLSVEEFKQATILGDKDLKLNLKNTVISIKNFSYVNWRKLSNKVSIVESTLIHDPSNVYSYMDEISRDRYRHVIEDMSIHSLFSESEIARKVVETANSSNISLQRHVGYYLIDNGYPHFTREIKYKPTLAGQIRDLIKEHPHSSYVGSVISLTTAISALSLAIFLKLTNIYPFVFWAMIAQLIPASDIGIFFVGKIFTAFLSPSLPPKIDLSGNVPTEYKTLVSVPCLIDSVAKIDSLVSNLEKRFLANKYKNLYFALLSDYVDSSELESQEDKKLLDYLKKRIKQLNTKHKPHGFDVFYLFHRNRLYNDSEKIWMGWERKRGKLMNLVSWLTRTMDSTTPFSTIEGKLEKLQNVQYVITLDEDTLLPADVALKLIGAMAHPLNSPVLNAEGNVVTRGYGFIQPRIILKPEAQSVSQFTGIFIAESGQDSYSAAVSDIYQDLFNRSNFMGKGIFNIKAIKDTLVGRFPENKLLSHDLIESCFAKAGFLSDTNLVEDFPSTFQSYLTRDNRWARGDWQLLPWLLPKVPSKNNHSSDNRLDFLSRWMIFDNLRRSLILPSYSILFILGLILSNSGFFTGYILFLFSTRLIFDLFSIKKFFVHKIPFLDKIYLSYFYLEKKIALVTNQFILLFILGFNKINSILKTIYRLIKKQHLLKWTTHSQAEQQINQKNQTWSLFLQLSILNLIVLTTLFLINRLSPLNIFLSLIWGYSPFYALYISKPYPKLLLSSQIRDQEKLVAYARKIWAFFEDYTNEKSNYLPPDNLQEVPSQKLATRTSPTNIGFYLLSLISALDLDFIDVSTYIERLEKTVNSLCRLPKYKGHFYNWCDTVTLEVLNPYISTADSGNLAVSLMILESTCLSLALDKNKKLDRVLSSRLLKIAHLVRRLYTKTDFTFLYNKEMSVFSIGFNTITKKTDASFYDLLASESRIASYVSIALDQIELKHWFNLARPLQINHGKFYLMSWGGTMFEYLLPFLLFNEKKNTLLGQTNSQIVNFQHHYAKENGIPWGISESNFDAFDFDSNYQYKMIGVPGLALKRYDSRDLVVSPYSTFLALMVDPAAAEKNLLTLEKMGVTGHYGFFESIDFNRSLKDPKKGESVKIYTAHHQGMSLVAINNVLHDKIMSSRLHNNDYIKSCEILLDEKIPEVSNVVKSNQYGLDKNFISASRFEKEKISYSDTPNPLFPLSHLYGNGKYSVLITNSGTGYSKFKETYLNRFTEDLTLDNSGHHIYIKNLDTGNIWSATHQPTLTKPEKYKVKFFTEHAEFHRTDRKTNTKLNIFVPPEKNFEIRELELTNSSYVTKSYEVTTYSEIMLDELKDGSNHPAFNKLFIETSYENGVLIAKRKKRTIRDSEKYAFHFAFSEDIDYLSNSYETNRLNFIGRTRSIKNPTALNTRLTNSIGNVLDPIFSLRYTIQLKPGETKKIYFIYGYADYLAEIQVAKELTNNVGEINELARLNLYRSETKRTHFGISPRQEILFQKIGSRLVYPGHRLKETPVINHQMGKSILYRFGISGNEKLLVVKVNCENLDLVRNLVILHEYFRFLRLQFDLVFIVDETQSYKEALERGIYEIVEGSTNRLQENLDIFILNSKNTSEDERNTLLYLAKVVLDTSTGSLEDQASLPSRYGETELLTTMDSLPKTVFRTGIYSNKSLVENPVFYNNHGGFLHDGKDYLIVTSPNKPTPQPWSNILTNKNFGTLVTESGLGYTWNINSQANKITPWSNDPVSDPQGEILYIKNLDTGRVFNPTPLPINDAEFKIIHSQGNSQFIGIHEEIEHTLKISVDDEDPVKILNLTLSNKSNHTKRLEIFYYVEFVLGDQRDTEQEALKIDYDPIRQSITAQNTLSNTFTRQIAFIDTSAPVFSATSDRKKFFGSSASKESPGWLYNSKKKIAEFKPVSDQCGVLGSQIEIPHNSQINITYILGQAEGMDKVNLLIDKYSNKDSIDKSYLETENKWNKLQSAITIKTPDPKLDYLINHWLLYQVVSSRLYGRTSFYQASGAFGFRDQLQDVMALIYAEPKKVRDHLILCCHHQFKEGDVQHWWHNTTNAGVRTRISDDLLWLPYVLNYYLEKTGDFSVLYEEAPYLEMPLLEKSEDSVYAIPTISNEKGTVLDHCLRAINKSLVFGVHGLPLMGSGDWNDSLNNVGVDGRGESVWLGWFLFSILSSFTKLADSVEGITEASQYKTVAKQLQDDLNSHGWDGEWYKRAFFDDGSPLGSSVNNECSIDSISQSWSVISKGGAVEKTNKALQSHEKYLENKGHFVKLLTPPFENSTPFPGYIQGYPPGVRENGGQYNHAVAWAVKAYSMKKMGDKAYDLYNLLNPISNSHTADKATVYQSEPYAVAADIYTSQQQAGRGGWSWYTGSASLSYQVAIEDILGFKKYSDYFLLDPVIPEAWDGFEMNVDLSGSQYKIKVSKGSGVSGVYINNQKVDNNKIYFKDHHGKVQISLIL